jgi:isoamylase
LNWLDADRDLLLFVQQLIHFRRQHPGFRRRRWFRGTPIIPGEIEDIAWLKFDGEHMKEEDWQHDYAEDWTKILDTSYGQPISQGEKGKVYQAGETITVQDNSI